MNFIVIIPNLGLNVLAGSKIKSLGQWAVSKISLTLVHMMQKNSSKSLCYFSFTFYLVHCEIWNWKFYTCIFFHLFSTWEKKNLRFFRFFLFSFSVTFLLFYPKTSHCNVTPKAQLMCCSRFCLNWKIGLEYTHTYSIW